METSERSWSQQLKGSGGHWFKSALLSGQCLTLGMLAPGIRPDLQKQRFAGESAEQTKSGSGPLTTLGMTMCLAGAAPDSALCDWDVVRKAGGHKVSG